MHLSSLTYINSIKVLLFNVFIVFLITSHISCMNFAGDEDDDDSDDDESAHVKAVDEKKLSSNNNDNDNNNGNVNEDNLVTYKIDAMNRFFDIEFITSFLLFIAEFSSIAIAHRLTGKTPICC